MRAEKKHGRERGGTVWPRAPEAAQERDGLRDRFAQTCLHPLRHRVPALDVAVFFRILRITVQSRLTLHQALVLLERQTRNGNLKWILGECHRHVAKGGRLSDVLVSYPWVFTGTQVAMVRAAEQGGHVDRVLSYLVKHLDRQWEHRRSLQGLVYAPLALFYLTVLTLGGSFFVSGIPAASRAIAGRYSSWGAGLLDTIGFALLVSLALMLAIALYRAVLQFWPAAREGYETFKAANAVTAPFARVGFCRAFAVMFASGLPLGEAIRASGEACGSLWLRWGADAAADLTGRGVSLAEAFAHSGRFPAGLVEHLATAQQTGNVDELMDAYARDTESQALSRLHAFVAGLTIAVVYGLFALVGAGIAALGRR